jgi:hypothetical protein
MGLWSYLNHLSPGATMQRRPKEVACSRPACPAAKYYCNIYQPLIISREAFFPTCPAPHKPEQARQPEQKASLVNTHSNARKACQFLFNLHIRNSHIRTSKSYFQAEIRPFTMHA